MINILELLLKEIQTNLKWDEVVMLILLQNVQVFLQLLETAQ